MFRKAALGLALAISFAPLWAQNFPLCIYTVNNVADLPAIKAAGFNCIQTYQTQPATIAKLAAAAQKHNMQLVAAPYKIIDTPMQEIAQNWPILAWYLFDEPDVHSMPRPALQAMHKQTKAAFPKHNTTFVIGQGKTVTPYYDIADILMVDWYPVPHLALDSFGQQLTLARQGMRVFGKDAKPLWGVVQIFDWKDFKQYRPDNNRIGRYPTFSEIRFMSYHAIVQGVSGLFYFTFDNDTNNILPIKSPATWQAVAAAVTEINTFTQLIADAKPIKLPSKIAIPLLGKAWQAKSGKYALIVNPSPAAQLLPKKLLKKRYKQLFTSQSMPMHISPHATLLIKY